MKHFQGSPREQTRGRIVAPHPMLATVRASRPLAQRRPALSREPYVLERYKPVCSEVLQVVERGCSAPRGSLYSHARGVVYWLGCGRWKCAPCARRNAAVVRERFKRMFWRRAPAMVTLTAATADDADPTPAAMRTFARRVASLRRWVTRHYGFFQWAWVREVAERDSRCVCHAALACRCGRGAPVARAYAVGRALRAAKGLERGGRAERPWPGAGRASGQRPARGTLRREVSDQVGPASGLCPRSLPTLRYARAAGAARGIRLALRFTEARAGRGRRTGLLRDRLGCRRMVRL